MIFERLRSWVAQWRAQEIDDQMGKLLPMESAILLTRRRILQTVVPAAIVMPVLAEELLHPGRSFFLPVADKFTWDVYAEVGEAAANVWIVNSLGGYLYSRQLSEVLRQSVQPLDRFRQFADVKQGVIQ